MAKGMTNILKQVQMVQTRMAKLQEDAVHKTAEATSGGGAVSVAVNGKNEILSLSIQKEVVNPEDVEMLRDLILTAAKEAQQKVQAELSGEMSRITGGMNIPGVF